MAKLQFFACSLIYQISLYLSGVYCNWEDWWTYDGISGPSYWGRLNPDWHLCAKGRRQSPVDIIPEALLYDPHLRPVHIDKERVTGSITNTGHSVVFRSENMTLNISGGPLSYRYRFEELHIHYGKKDERGSEHRVAGYSFPAELQIMGYNSDLFNNMSEAVELRRSESIIGISVMVQIGDLSNSELRVLTSQLPKIIYRGQSSRLKHLSIRELLPDTEFFMTYEGSLTTPGCYETATWIIMNKPIYITKQQLYILRKLMQGDEANPKAPLADNYRSIYALNHRVIRTNIEFQRPKGKTCPSMSPSVFYQAKVWSSNSSP